MTLALSIILILLLAFTILQNAAVIAALDQCLLLLELLINEGGKK